MRFQIKTRSTHLCIGKITFLSFPSKLVVDLLEDITVEYQKGMIEKMKFQQTLNRKMSLEMTPEFENPVGTTNQPPHHVNILLCCVFAGNYTKCRDDQFQCDDHYCIPKDLKCNGYPECPDNSDEKDCGMFTTSICL